MYAEKFKELPVKKIIYIALACATLAGCDFQPVINVSVMDLVAIGVVGVVVGVALTLIAQCHASLGCGS